MQVAFTVQRKMIVMIGRSGELLAVAAAAVQVAEFHRVERRRSLHHNIHHRSPMTKWTVISAGHDFTYCPLDNQ